MIALVVYLVVVFALLAALAAVATQRDRARYELGDVRAELAATRVILAAHRLQAATEDRRRQ